MKTASRRFSLIVVAVLLLLVLACNLPSLGAATATPAEEPTQEVQIEPTQEVAQPPTPDQQATQLALQMANLQATQQALQTNLQATQQALQVAADTAATQVASQGSSNQQSTLQAMQATANAIAVQQTVMAVQLTSAAQNPPAQTAAPNNPNPTQSPQPTPTVDVMAKIKNAKILVYEDVAAEYQLDRRIKRALINLNLTGSNVVQVDDLMGTFLKQLNSGTKWDLVIVGAESRSVISGDYWDVIDGLLNKKTALITEIWYLNRISNGKIAPVLHDCGIAFERNWTRSSAYDPNNYVIYALAPDNDVFNTPNKVGGYLSPSAYWPDGAPYWDTGDVGDLLGLTPGSSATMLAGIYKDRSNSGGLVASCYDGRVIFQTFDTHDYFKGDTVALWENYIIYTLTNHFAALP